MKNVFLSICLLIGINAVSRAQNSITTTSVSKNKFVEDVNQLNQLVSHDEKDKAAIKWSEILMMMTQDIQNKEARMMVADAAKKEQYRQEMIDQLNLAKAIAGLQSNMSANNSAMQTKLAEFATAINQ